ncbi:hypothetical protein ANCCAN_22949 [Ancylostoma caninum]|uniref:G-protein coupled receptors family 1 profile domain-containing protein n=1 Tax=Ancylostoma caninum TaxID=29170 RepID=A0A368FM68_ANCCA|nr:hypothetical protein ANCCAN_22949 [Ancylostoma caninum]
MAVLWKRAMRTNRNVLILNLALSNLVLALTNIPFLWLPSIDFEFPYSRFFCKIANVLPGSNIYCSTLTISVMAIDRTWAQNFLFLHGFTASQRSDSIGSPFVRNPQNNKERLTACTAVRPLAHVFCSEPWETQM